MGLFNSPLMFRYLKNQDFDTFDTSSVSSSGITSSRYSVTGTPSRIDLKLLVKNSIGVEWIANRFWIKPRFHLTTGSLWCRKANACCRELWISSTCWHTNSANANDKLVWRRLASECSVAATIRSFASVSLLNWFLVQ